MPAVPVVTAQPNVEVNIGVSGAGGTASDTFPNDGETLLYAQNNTAGTQTLTIAASKPCDQGFLHDRVVALQPTHRILLGPFPLDRFAPALTVTGGDGNTVKLAVKIP